MAETINLKLNIDDGKSAASLGALRRELKEIDKLMQSASVAGNVKLYDELSKKYIETKERANDLRDTLQPMEVHMRTLTGTIGGLTTIGAGLATVFGADSKSAEALFKTFAKAQAIGQVVNGMGQMMDMAGKLGPALKAVGVAIKTAFLSNPVTLIIAAVAALAVGIAALTTGLDDNIDKMEEWRENMRYNAEQATTYFNNTLSSIENISKRLQDARDADLTSLQVEQKQAEKNFSIYANNAQSQIDAMKVLVEERSAMAKKYEEYAAAESDFTLKQQWYDRAEQAEKDALELRNKLAKNQSDLNGLQDKYTQKIVLATEEIKKLEEANKAAEDAERAREKWRTETDRLRKEIERAKIDAIDDEIQKLEAKAIYEIEITKKIIADEKVKAERILQIEQKLTADILKIKQKEEDERLTLWEQRAEAARKLANKEQDEVDKQFTEIFERLKTNNESELEELQRKYIQEYQIIKGNRDLEIELEQEYAKKIVQINAEKEKELLEQSFDGMQATANLANSLYNYQTQLMNNELEAAGDNEEKKDEIRREYANKRQAAAISEALIAGALSILRIWESQATGNAIADAIIKGVMTAAVVVTTGTQIATIEQQSFAQGGMVQGAFNGTDNQQVNAMPGEAIINRSATQKFAPILSAINASTGGNSFSSAQIIDYDLLASKINDKEVYIVSHKITDRQKKDTKIKNKASF